jgi:hypothetical protein
MNPKHLVLELVLGLVLSLNYTHITARGPRMVAQLQEMKEYGAC